MQTRFLNLERTDLICFECKSVLLSIVFDSKVSKGVEGQLSVNCRKCDKTTKENVYSGSN